MRRTQSALNNAMPRHTAQHRDRQRPLPQGLGSVADHEVEEHGAQTDDDDCSDWHARHDKHQQPPMEEGPRAEAQTQWLRCVAYALGTDDVSIMSQALRVHEAVWGRAGGVPKVVPDGTTGGRCLGSGLARAPSFSLVTGGPVVQHAFGDTLLHLAQRNVRPRCAALLEEQLPALAQERNAAQELPKDLHRPVALAAAAPAATVAAVAPAAAAPARITFRQTTGEGERGDGGSSVDHKAERKAELHRRASLRHSSGSSMRLPSSRRNVKEDSGAHVTRPFAVTDSGVRFRQWRSETNKRDLQRASEGMLVSRAAPQAAINFTGWPKNSSWFNQFVAARARRQEPAYQGAGGEQLPWNLRNTLWVKNDHVYSHLCWAKVKARLSFENGQGVLRLTFVHPSATASHEAPFMTGYISGHETLGISTKHTQKHEAHRMQFELREFKHEAHGSGGGSKDGKDGKDSPDHITFQAEETSVARQWISALDATVVHARQHFRQRAQQAHAEAERIALAQNSQRRFLRPSVPPPPAAAYNTPIEVKRKLAQGGSSPLGGFQHEPLHMRMSRAQEQGHDRAARRASNVARKGSASLVSAAMAMGDVNVGTLAEQATEAAKRAKERAAYLSNQGNLMEAMCDAMEDMGDKREQIMLQEQRLEGQCLGSPDGDRLLAESLSPVHGSSSRRPLYGTGTYDDGEPDPLDLRD